MAISPKRKQILRQNRIIGHRRRLGLCIKCGLEINSCGRNCDEVEPTYEKADMRPKPPKHINEEKRIKTILAYRRKKGLCEKCGLTPNSCGRNCDEVEPTYEKADMRSEEQKNIDPRTISYQKVYIEPKPIDEDIHPIKYNREFILLNLNKSKQGYGFEMEFISYFCRKYKDFIIITMGDYEKLFTLYQIQKLNKMVNIIPMKNEMPDIIRNHLHSCSHFFSFECSWTEYSKQHEIPTFVFKDGKNLISINNI